MSERGPTTSKLLGCADVEELLPLHALGALDADEAEAIAAHLPLCPACSAAVVHFEAVAGLLPAALPPIAPSSEARAALLDRLDERPAQRAPVSLANERRALHARLRMLVAAAAILLIIGGTGYWITNLVDERNEARDTANTLAQFVSPNAVAVPLAAMPAGEYEWGWGSSRLLKDADGRMIVVVEGCPPTTDERRYRVWVSEAGARMPVGEVIINENGTGWMPVSFPDEMPAPEVLGITVIEGDAPATDLFIGQMT